MKFGTLNGIAAALVLTGATAGQVFAGAVKLPSTLAWSAYNMVTTGYNQSVAIGKALKDKYGVSLRVVPDLTAFMRRMTPDSGRQRTDQRAVTAG